MSTTSTPAQSPLLFRAVALARAHVNSAMALAAVVLAMSSPALAFELDENMLASDAASLVSDINGGFVTKDLHALYWKNKENESSKALDSQLKLIENNLDLLEQVAVHSILSIEQGKPAITKKLLAAAEKVDAEGASEHLTELLTMAVNRATAEARQAVIDDYKSTQSSVLAAKSRLKRLQDPKGGSNTTTYVLSSMPFEVTVPDRMEELFDGAGPSTISLNIAGRHEPVVSDLVLQIGLGNSLGEKPLPFQIVSAACDLLNANMQLQCSSTPVTWHGFKGFYLKEAPSIPDATEGARAYGAMFVTSENPPVITTIVSLHRETTEPTTADAVLATVRPASVASPKP